MSQPAVSKAIADLERTLGVKLLHRGCRGVEPTPYGAVLVQHGFAMFDELRRSVEHIDFISDPTAGDIRIGTTEPVATAIVSPVVSQMSKRYPKISFQPTDPIPISSGCRSSASPPSTHPTCRAC
jgi:DNA-binding transcriptional LysR family regulator